MNRRSLSLVLTLLGLPVLPLCAQTVIGGGTCNSATLSGTYELLLSGRQFSASGTGTQIFQGVGTAAFDGLSKVTISLTANMVASSQSFGQQVTYSGTYSMQANCVGAMSITTGDTATFTLEAYNQPGSATVASGFAVVGSDATYAFNGTGTAQPATCPTTISGAHEFSATGSGLSGTTPTSTLDVAGILNFNSGAITASWTQASNLTVAQVSATGTYTVGAGCLASAALTDTANNKYTFNFSFTSASPGFSLAASSPTEIFDGSGSGMQAAAVTSCNTAMLDGTYYMPLAGRLAPSGAPTKILLAEGSATFDGLGHVTFNLTADSVNGSQTFGTPLTYSGTYSLQSTCQGSVNITTGDTATFAIVAYNFNTTTMQAKNYTMVGTDAAYAYNASGAIQPAACAVSTLSGTWPFSGTGNSISGANITGLEDLEGVMQFDGQGNVTATWTQVSNSATTPVSATGTYTVTGACLGTISLTDTSSNAYSGELAMEAPDSYGYPNDFSVVLANSQLLFTGGGRASFVNPGEAIDNNADFGPSATPAGSVFSLFGTNLATKQSQPTTVPLPTKLLTTTLSVNGEAAPLFYVSPEQLVAQMPEDIKTGIATVMVANGSSNSNAVAVIVPTASPEIDVYGNNLAVVTFTDYSVVTSSNRAKAGDTVVLWFTGGGPVNAAGKLTSGAVAPAGLSPVTGSYTITVGGTQATSISYVGLTPGSIGLYQASFVVPSVASGANAVVLTISGQASNGPTMYVK